MGGAATAPLDDPGQALSQEDFVLSAATRIGDLPCPHCGSKTFRDSSRLLTPLFREVFYACRNVACGHTFKASLSYEYGLSPSAIPNPEMNLPLRPMERVPGVTIPATTGPPEPDPNQFHLFED